MPEQFDPRIYERFVAPSVPVNPEQINQYNQQTIPVAVPVPEIENYAQQQQMPQQQFVQQAPQQQMLQPDPRRLAYNKLIEDRFNELANKFGGVRYLAETGNLERAQKKAARDIASYWGPPPEIQQPEQPLRSQSIPGTGKMLVMGAGMTSPQLVDAVEPNQAPKTSRVETIPGMQGKVIVYPADGSAPKIIDTFGKYEEAQATSAKAVDDKVKLLTGINDSFDQLLSDKDALEWASGLSNKVFGGMSTDIKGTREKIANIEKQIALYGREALKGGGQGQISDADQAMVAKAAARFVTEGSDKDLIDSLVGAKARFKALLDEARQSKPTNQQTGKVESGADMEMEMNPATGRFEPKK